MTLSLLRVSAGVAEAAQPELCRHCRRDDNDTNFDGVIAHRNAPSCRGITGEHPADTFGEMNEESSGCVVENHIAQYMAIGRRNVQTVVCKETL